MKAERAIVVACDGEQLPAVLHPSGPNSDTGVLLVVGGPQYRVGSHRQFVLMARHLAGEGFPVLRFDYRGMGDATGEPRQFDSTAEDIQAAIVEFRNQCPGLCKFVLAGLCDAASAILIHRAAGHHSDGMILINPWVRTNSTEARQYLKRYYIQRLMQKSFWQKVRTDEYSFLESARELFSTVRLVLLGRRDGESQSTDFIEHMRSGMLAMEGSVLCLISGDDLTAAEFVDLCRSDEQWGHLLARPTVHIEQLPDADHTYSRRQDLDAANALCVDFLRNYVKSGE